MDSYSTGTISSYLDNCDSIKELKAIILPQLQCQREAWSNKIGQILDENHYTYRQLAQLCKVSEPAVRKWKNGTLPQSRDMYIRIGFSAGYDLKGMNTFLQRYGRCPKLYVKSLEDSVCMFVLQSDKVEHTYDTYLRQLELVRAEYQGVDQCEAVHAYSTDALVERFSNVRDTTEMIKFAKEHAPSYKQAYSRLYDYINLFLQLNLSDDILSALDGRKASFHSMATESRWSSSLRHCISDIRNRRWFPLRHKVISLGLHLNMDNEAINTMLQYAQMERLYVKNPIEATISWAIEEVKLSTVGDHIDTDGSSMLCNYVKSVLIQLGLGNNSDYLIEDL